MSKVPPGSSKNYFKKKKKSCLHMFLYMFVHFLRTPGKKGSSCTPFVGSHSCHTSHS